MNMHNYSFCQVKIIRLQFKYIFKQLIDKFWWKIQWVTYGTELLTKIPLLIFSSQQICQFLHKSLIITTKALTNFDHFIYATIFSRPQFQSGDQVEEAVIWYSVSCSE